RLSDPRTRNLLPLLLALTREPRGVVEKVCWRQAARRQLDDPLGAADFQPEARLLAGAVLDRPEGRLDALVKAVGRVDVIAEDRPHALAAIRHVGLRRRLAVL